MSYAPNVEKWRPYVQKYLPGDVEKWLHVIDGESKGNPSAVGDGGASLGLFQSQHIPKGASVDQQFADAAKLYKADIANGGTGFGDWGEGRLYKGKPFGSLGNNPYRGGSNVSAASTSGNDQTAMDAWIEQQIGPQRKPTDFSDDSPADIQSGKGSTASEKYDAWLTGWIANKAKLVPAYRAAFPTAADRTSDYGPVQAGIAQQNADTGGLNAQISLLDTKVKAGQLDASEAATQLQAWLTGRTQADNEAQLVQNSNDLLAKYGVPVGQEKQTAGQAGQAFVQWAKLLDGDENSVVHDFTGKTAMSDPYGDIARMRAQNGVAGPQPAIPQGTGTSLLNGFDPTGGNNGAPSATGPTYSDNGYSTPADAKDPTNPQNPYNIDPNNPTPGVAPGSGLLGGQPPNMVKPGGLLSGARDDWNQPKPAMVGPTEPGSAPPGTTMGPQQGRPDPATDPIGYARWRISQGVHGLLAGAA